METPESAIGSTVLGKPKLMLYTSTFLMWESFLFYLQHTGFLTVACFYFLLSKTNVEFQNPPLTNALTEIVDVWFSSIALSRILV